MIYPCSRSPYSRKFADDSHPHVGYDYVYDPIEVQAVYTPVIGAFQYTPTAIPAGVTFSPAAPTMALTISAIVCGVTFSPGVPAYSIYPAAIISAGVEFLATVILKVFIPLDTLDVKSVSVSKSVDDQTWALNANLVGYYELNLTSFKHVTYTTTDHLGVSQNIFSGILPKTQMSIAECADQTSINGVDYAWFLGNQYVPATWQHNTKTVNPATIITGLLGGEDWQETTGIYPYNIDTVSEWGVTLNTRVFDFEVSTSKWSAIQKICKYTRYLFIVKWKTIDGVATPCAYFISRANLDTAADLPAALTITNPDSYLIDKIGIEIKGDERYNKVTVIGRDNTGGLFTASEETAAVTNGDELAVEIVENSGAWTTQAQVDARALELYTYYAIPGDVYTATFLDRMDIELLQKIRFTGYDEISTDWMRITKITKTISAGDTVKKTVQITFTSDEKWQAIQSMYRSSDSDLTSDTENIAKTVMGNLGTTQVGTVVSINGTDVEVLLEDGTTQTVRGVV